MAVPTSASERGVATRSRLRLREGMATRDFKPYSPTLVERRFTASPGSQGTEALDAIIVEALATIIAKLGLEQCFPIRDKALKSVLTRAAHNDVALSSAMVQLELALVQLE